MICRHMHNVYNEFSFHWQVIKFHEDTLAFPSELAACYLYTIYLKQWI